MTRREIEKNLKPKLSDRDLKIILDYANGISQAAIARELNLSRERVRQILVEISGENSPPVRAEMDHREFVLFRILRDEMRMSNKEIANELGLGDATIKHYFNQENSLTNQGKAKIARGILGIIAKRLIVIEEILERITP